MATEELLRVQIRPDDYETSDSEPIVFVGV
jgi:hypothetical protein